MCSKRIGAPRLMKLGRPAVRVDVQSARHDVAHRARQRTRCKHALLVEHAVVRQVDLEPQARDPATLQQRRGVTELAVFDRRRADERPSAVSCASVSMAAGHAACSAGVSTDEQLREQDQVGAGRSRLDAGAARLVGIAGNIADNWIELGRSSQFHLAPAGQQSCNRRRSAHR
jgi:hypothetical protein